MRMKLFLPIYWTERWCCRKNHVFLCLVQIEQLFTTTSIIQSWRKCWTVISYEQFRKETQPTSELDNDIYQSSLNSLNLRKELSIRQNFIDCYPSVNEANNQSNRFYSEHDHNDKISLTNASFSTLLASKSRLDRFLAKRKEKIDIDAIPMIEHSRAIYFTAGSLSSFFYSTFYFTESTQPMDTKISYQSKRVYYFIVK